MPHTAQPSVLLIGTVDTKSAEIFFLRDRLRAAGATPIVMDVGVLDGGADSVDIPNQAVAAAAGSTIPAIKALGDENLAMAAMARGAAALARDLRISGGLDGMLALGGTMGTDLALDVAAALPLGVPKFIVSTVAHSHLIPPERLAPDLAMVLWAGGLYGLNSVCRAVLAQAAGAVAGAARLAQRERATRPIVGISSLGKSCLKYMVRLVPALEARGYEVAVFHATGLGGRAMEALAVEQRFAALFDLALCEVGQLHFDSPTSAGAERLLTPGIEAIPRILGPGGLDMIDLPTWRPLPAAYEGRDYHAHNRLLASVGVTTEEARAVSRFVGERVSAGAGHRVFLLPCRGIEEWDREGEAMHDPARLAAFVEGFTASIRPPVELQRLDCHINDPAYAEAALAVFDRWTADGIVRPAGDPGQRLRDVSPPRS